MSNHEPIDRDSLLRELRELLPGPVREGTQLDGSLVMIGGDPGEVIIRVSGNKLTVAAFSVRWEGPHTPAVRPQHCATLSWKRLPASTPHMTLHGLVRGACELRTAWCDVYWWSIDAPPLSGTNRKQGLLRQSVKMCVWLGPANCFRNQDNVLWLPSDDIFAERKSDSAMRTSPSGRNYRNGQIADAAEERGSSTPFNLIPVAAGGSAAADIQHPASTPYDVAAWWCKYLLPQDGVVLDCFAGSGTMLCAGLDFGASQVLGIEKERRYIKIAEQRIVEG